MHFPFLDNLYYPELSFIVFTGFMSDILSHLCSLYSCVIKVIYMFRITLCI